MSRSLEEEVGRIKGKVEALEEAAKGVSGRIHAMGQRESEAKSAHESIADIEARLQAVEAVINMGRGALWVFLKISAFVAAVGAVFTWPWAKP